MQLHLTIKMYLSPYPIVPCGYLNRCFITTQCICLGSTMNWLKELAMKQIFDLVFTRYNKDPISCLYIVGSTKYEVEVVSLKLFKFMTVGVSMNLQSIIPNLLNISIAYFPCERKISSYLYHTYNPRK